MGVRGMAEMEQLVQSSLNMRSLVSQMWHVTEDLDTLDVKLLCGLNQDGARNVSQVASKLGIPSSTAYLRLKRMNRLGPIMFAYPELSKLGLKRAVVMIRPQLSEHDTTEMMKSLGYWTAWGIADGAFTSHWVFAIPATYSSKIPSLLEEAHHQGAISEFQFYETSDYRPNFPNFKLFDPEQKTWTFDWPKWLDDVLEPAEATAPQTRMPVADPPSYERLVDRTDILIIKELQKDACKSFTDIAKVAGVTVQVAAYRYHRLEKLRCLTGHSSELQIYPPQISSLREFKVRFTSASALDNFVKAAWSMFVVAGYAKKLKEDTLLLRVYVPVTEEGNLYIFLKELNERGIIKDYPSVRLHPFRREFQTISYELFDEKQGWMKPQPCMIPKNNSPIHPRYSAW